MTTHVTVSATGDYVLTRPVGDLGRLTIAWSPALTTQTIQLLSRHLDPDGTTIDVPVANGKLGTGGATLDSQSVALQSVNIECRCDVIVARVGGTVSPSIDIWCS